MKSKIFFLLVFLFTITLGKAQTEEYFWVAVSDSSALPVSSNRTANTELNTIFEKYHVTNYFYRFDYPYWFDDSVINLQMYEIQFQYSYDYSNPTYSAEFCLRDELLASGLFSHLFRFSEGYGDILAIGKDSTVLPASDTSSKNNEINAILEGFNIAHYTNYSNPDRQIIRIACDSVIELYVRLSQLDGLFLGFVISERPITCMEYSCDKVSIQDIFENKDIQIFPNPFSDIIFINSENIRTIKVYNTAGMLVYSQDKGDYEKIDLSFLSMGMYILKIQTDDGKAVYNKIMKGGK